LNQKYVQDGGIAIVSNTE